MVTDRDKYAIDFIRKFKTVDSKQINDEVYQNINTCCNRLARLTKQGALYRKRDLYTIGYIYSTEKIKDKAQLWHNRVRVNVYEKLKEIGATIQMFQTEANCGSLRPDAIVIFEYEGKTHFWALEVEVNDINYKTAHKFDIYNEWYAGEYKDYFNAKPLLVFITDKCFDVVETYGIEYKFCDIKLKNFDDLLK